MFCCPKRNFLSLRADGDGGVLGELTQGKLEKGEP